jgi:peptidoglycan/LPS O-acetylase OafA/YrhL
MPIETLNARIPIKKLDWLDPLKAFALLAILLNHLVEEFFPGPWFTNPSEDWPDLATRLFSIFPAGHGFFLSLIQFLGWLGDSGPGVFIFCSGFGLAWSSLHKPETDEKIGDFYRKRLLRIFPLYVAMHLVILSASLVVPGSDLTLGSPKTLLSLLGLRFTGSLFFYINPSWWFIWVIIQLYLVYPFLIRILRRNGVITFLVLTCAVTFISRALGIAGVQYSSLYFWMTGIFAGTRLAEFAVGMVAADYFYRTVQAGGKIPGLKTVAAISSPVYLFGLGCSFTWPGTIVANLFVTLGLSGIFYTLWEALKKQRFLAAAATWIGIEAYSVFLLHQAPLQWTRGVASPSGHLLAALAVLALAFPAGWGISRAVARLQKEFPNLKGKIPVGLATWLGAAGVAAALLFVEPRLGNEWKHRAFSLVLGVSVAGLALVEWAAKPGRGDFAGILCRWTAISAGLLQLFVLPPQFGMLALFCGLLFGLAGAFCNGLFHCKAKSLLFSAATAAVLVLGLEFLLMQFVPLEAGRWGEYPALQIHPTRVYSLKPNQVTHLKYNNYDYILKTNSLGLPGPEIQPIEKPPGLFRILIIGDAFTMPEGMEYDKAYPALLQQKFDPQRVQVINAGVTGYGPVEELPQLFELLPMLQPDLVVYEFFINEFEEVQIDPVDRLKGIGLITEGASRHRRLFSTSQINAHLSRARERASETLRNKPGGWRYGKSLLQFYETGRRQMYGPENLALLGRYLAEMKSACQRHGAELVIYFVPGAVAVSKPEHIDYFPWGVDLSDRSIYELDRPLNALRGLAAEIGLPVVDLTSHLKSNTVQPVYFPGSWHWNPEGHRVVASVIHDDIVGRGVWQP